jgi:hypothetical protein
MKLVKQVYRFLWKSGCSSDSNSRARPIQAVGAQILKHVGQTAFNAEFQRLFVNLAVLWLLQPLISVGTTG